ncbi:hypothetical protein VF04_34990 [Nostoc linckia z7]|uniref:Phage protein n=1 Tax=Nostoc linckia z7 TaxID=1628745 RepID=A0ABX4KEI3_NOSLI|nr:hypothetical protein [Nostoc linckia]PHJ59269.1 hypothetical protein VF05_32265 [Nostoc linckia z3]PHJ63664.1 hypothetical protein VF03_30140 [Nostoc linckia z2]PHJ73874.1 hypothetical protein VF06_35750 [Nostoc linckia z4]PHJ87185.1 hypothetical protein VF04_34990 [Nostoc linckia z7]
MKTGIELIAEERQEQIEKHLYRVKDDVDHNGAMQLCNAAVHLLGQYSCFDFDDTEDFLPSQWNAEIYKKMTLKKYRERLIIAGALIAAEIDRIQNAAN